MAEIATNVDHKIAEMIRGAKVPDACAQAKHAIDAANHAAERARNFSIDTSVIDAAVKTAQNANAEAKRALEACNSAIARAKAITPVKA